MHVCAVVLQTKWKFHCINYLKVTRANNNVCFFHRYQGKVPGYQLPRYSRCLWVVADSNTHVCVCVHACVCRQVWHNSLTNWRHTCQLVTSLVYKIPSPVSVRVSIWLLGLGLGSVLGHLVWRMSMYVCMCSTWHVTQAKSLVTRLRWVDVSTYLVSSALTLARPC